MKFNANIGLEVHAEIRIHLWLNKDVCKYYLSPEQAVNINADKCIKLYFNNIQFRGHIVNVTNFWLLCCWARFHILVVQHTFWYFPNCTILYNFMTLCIMTLNSNIHFIHAHQLKAWCYKIVQNDALWNIQKLSIGWGAHMSHVLWLDWIQHWTVPFETNPRTSLLSLNSTRLANLNLFFILQQYSHIAPTFIVGPFRGLVILSSTGWLKWRLLSTLDSVS